MKGKCKYIQWQEAEEYYLCTLSDQRCSGFEGCDDYEENE
jgi:hypothetical protein